MKVESEFNEQWKQGAFRGRALPSGSIVEFQHPGSWFSKGMLTDLVSIDPEPVYVVWNEDDQGETYEAQIKQSEICGVFRVGVTDNHNEQDDAFAETVVKEWHEPHRS